MAGGPRTAGRRATAGDVALSKLCNSLIPPILAQSAGGNELKELFITPDSVIDTFNLFVLPIMCISKREEIVLRRKESSCVCLLWVSGEIPFLFYFHLTCKTLANFS